MNASPIDSDIFGELYGTVSMRELFSDEHSLQRMLDAEAALARVQARLGIIPQEAADAITAAARVDAIDMKKVAATTRHVGYPVVALARELRNEAGNAAAPFVHYGATTQDILDTALMLQIREGLTLLARDLSTLIAALVNKATIYRDDVMAGRTHLQHAVPVTFGYKCATWAAPLVDHLHGLRAAQRSLRVQYGGAAGTLAPLGDRAQSVVQAFADELHLAVPLAPWHSDRTPIATVVSQLGLLCGSLAKFAYDVALLMQTEIAEVAEPHEHGRGSSSTMPQKRNPLAAEYALAAARGAMAAVPLALGAMVGDHERSTGAWQSERLALAPAFVFTAGALHHCVTIARGMHVDAERMRRNLEATGGLIMAEAVQYALRPLLGDQAHEVVERAANQALERHVSFLDALADDPRVAPHFDRERLAELLEPATYLGGAAAVVDRVVAAAQASLQPSP